jgi:hypothetical protein
MNDFKVVLVALYHNTSVCELETLNGNIQHIAFVWAPAHHGCAQGIDGDRSHPVIKGMTAVNGETLMPKAHPSILIPPYCNLSTAVKVLCFPN